MVFFSFGESGTFSKDFSTFCERTSLTKKVRTALNTAGINAHLATVLTSSFVSASSNSASSGPMTAPKLSPAL